MKKLNDEDKMNIGFIFMDEITKNRELAACEFACGEITKAQLESRRKHADYTEELWMCLVKILNNN